MAHALKDFSIFLKNPVWHFFRSEKPLPGEHQYCGPHFLAAILYAVKLAADHNSATFSDGLTTLEELAVKHSFDSAKLEGRQKILDSMASFLTEIKGIFAVQQLQQCSSSDITPKVVDVIASFIMFLVDAFEKSSSPSCFWIIIPSKINILCKRLKFLIVLLRDTPFWCPQLEGRKDILAAIESIANEAGIFLYSFFFTTDHVTTMTMDLELSLLLSKLEVVEGKIKEHCLVVIEPRKFTSPSLTSASIFIVDSFTDDLNHLLNHKADLIVEVKEQITTLHEELYSSRSMLRDIELQQNKELVEYEMQLIDLAYQAEYIFDCFAAWEVPVWYLSFRLPSFIKRNKSIWTSLKKTKLTSGTRDVQVVESCRGVSSSEVATKNIPKVDETIVGFKETTRQIVDQLFGGPDHLQIVSIVGMGGLGKTTLARKLYNDLNVVHRFDRRSWCVVSQSYQKKKLLIDILSSLSDLNKDAFSDMEVYELADRIYKSLKGNRYLLVVDDIWSEEAWNDLKRYFPDDKNGSRILFTSRNKNVAFDSIINELPLLTADESWDLLHKKVFGDSCFPQELQEVGMEIAENCKGLPLAVVGIASILANMEKNERVWKEVATSLSSFISKNQDILELSYKHLPSHLKPCFLYLCMFKEDEEISVKQLLSLWVSEGFIPKNKDKIPEGVAEDYLLALINRSMVQVGERRSDNGVKTFTMHDMMRDMCLRLADRENFVNEELSTYDQHQHICIYSDSTDFYSIPFGVHIRSLFSNFWDLSYIASSMKRLKVLKLSNRSIGYDGTICGFLVQLRHLECAGNLSNFSSHTNLEFLSTGELGGDMRLDMPKLRHLQCKSFKAIPKNWDTSITNCLQTLSGIIIHDVEDEEKLRCFSSLRRLKCRYEESWKGYPDFSSLSQLVSLTIQGVDFPKFNVIYFPSHIKKLYLHTMGLTCRMMSSIGKLPNLEILKLYGIFFDEMEWNTNDDEFQNLKFLKLGRSNNFQWNTSADHFPTLEKLVFARCSKLGFSSSDLGYIPTLQRIEVHRCSVDVRNFAKCIEEEQDEVGNEQLKVIINGTYLGD